MHCPFQKELNFFLYYGTSHSLRVIQKNWRLIQQIITLCSLSKHCDRTTKNLFLLMSKMYTGKAPSIVYDANYTQNSRVQTNDSCHLHYKDASTYLRRLCLCHQKGKTCFHITWIINWVPNLNWYWCRWFIFCIWQCFRDIVCRVVGPYGGGMHLNMYNFLFSKKLLMLDCQLSLTFYYFWPKWSIKIVCCRPTKIGQLEYIKIYSSYFLDKLVWEWWSLERKKY